MKLNEPIELVALELREDDLLFHKSFIDRLGGPEKAREYLLDIIDRYFTSEYIRFEED